MKRIYTLLLLTIISFCALAQNVTLTFTGRDASRGYVQLDRVVVTNHTRGWQETLLWPDTTLTLMCTNGIGDYAENGGLVLAQNMIRCSRKQS